MEIEVISFVKYQIQQTLTGHNRISLFFIMNMNFQSPFEIMVVNTSVVDFNSESISKAKSDHLEIICESDESTILRTSLCHEAVVLKCIKTLRNGGTKSDDDIDREICALQLLCTKASLHIMTYHGYERRPEVVTMILGYVQGPTLRDWILSPPRVNEDLWTTKPAFPQDSWMLRKSILSGILTGVKAIHEFNCAHNDLNPSNIVLSLPTLFPVIVDVGISTLPVGSQSKSVQSTAAKLGSQTRIFKTSALSKGYTVGYTAPERLQSCEMGFKSDQLSDLYRFHL